MFFMIISNLSSFDVELLILFAANGIKKSHRTGLTGKTLIFNIFLLITVCLFMNNGSGEDIDQYLVLTPSPSPSKAAILKYILANYKINPTTANQHLKSALRAGIKKKTLK